MSDVDLPPVGQRLGQGDLDRLVQNFQRASQWQATTVSMTGEGRGRQVVAVVNARGVLQSLDIPDVACRADGAELARDVVQAVSAARSDVAEQLPAAGRITFGDESPEVATLAAAAAARSAASIVAERGSVDEGETTQRERGLRDGSPAPLSPPGTTSPWPPAAAPTTPPSDPGRW